MLSPSKIKANLLGTPYSLKRASTATGSVAEISAPKRSATSKGTLKHIKTEKKLRTKHIKKVDMRRENMAKTEMALTFLFICLKFILYADSKRSVGKNTKNNISGVSLKLPMKESMSSLTRGTIKTPVNTKRTVYGIFNFFETKNTPVEIRSKINIERKTSIEISIFAITLLFLYY